MPTIPAKTNPTVDEQALQTRKQALRSAAQLLNETIDALENNATDPADNWANLDTAGKVALVRVGLLIALKGLRFLAYRELK